MLYNNIVENGAGPPILFIGYRQAQAGKPAAADGISVCCKNWYNLCGKNGCDLYRRSALIRWLQTHRANLIKILFFDFDPSISDQECRKL